MCTAASIITTGAQSNCIDMTQRLHSTEAGASPASAEAAAEADPELGFLVGVPGEAGLEGVVFIQVPFGAFQWTPTGPESPDVIPALMQQL